MGNTCTTCIEELNEQYADIIKRLDKHVSRAVTVTIIAASVCLFCILAASFCVAKTIKFINSFEYVEETVVEQDSSGNNIAIVVD